MTSKIDDGGAAFPSHAGDPEATDPRNRISCGGLTKRDYFAAAALTGLASRAGSECGFKLEYAKAAYEYADALIAASKEADHA